MKKRVLVISTGGSPHGVHANERSEGRYNINMALLFSKYGYDVDFINGYTRSTMLDNYGSRQPSGITFLREINFEKKYYIIFHHMQIPRENPLLWAKLKSITKYSIFGTFWPISIVQQKLFPSTNSIIVTPYRACHPVYRIPMSWVDKIPAPGFEHKSVICTARAPLTNDKSDRKVAVNVLHFEIMLEAAEKGYSITFTCHNDFFIGSSPHWQHVAPSIMKKAEDVYSILRKHPKVSFHPMLQQDKFDKLLSQHSIGVTLDSLSSVHRMIPMGVVPMGWDDNGHGYYSQSTLHKLTGSGLRYEFITKNMIRDRLFKLLEDRAFYDQQFNIVKDECPNVTTEEALRDLDIVVKLLESGSNIYGQPP